MGVPHFGASESAEVLYEQFGLTARHFPEKAQMLAARSKS